MPKGITEKQIKAMAKEAAAEKKDKVRSLGNGLYIVACASGNIVYRIRTRDKKTERYSWRAVGNYEDISFIDAMQKAIIYKSAADNDTPPPLTFREVSAEILPRIQETQKNEKARRNMDYFIDRYILPYIGDMQISEIKTLDLFAIMERMSARGLGNTITKTLQLVSRIFDKAILKGYRADNPYTPMRREHKPNKTEHYSAVTDPDAVGDLMRKIESYPQKITRLALKFSAYTFGRPGEIRHAEWGEIDIDKKIWTIPGDKMKAGRDHRVPLSSQVLDILSELRAITGECFFIFPSSRSPMGNRPMSENTIRAALRSLGYENKADTKNGVYGMTAHGFRAMASTLLNTSGRFRADVIEKQLAHEERNKTRDAYNHADYWNERVIMCQWYADYLDALKIGLKICDADNAAA